MKWPMRQILDSIISPKDVCECECECNFFSFVWTYTVFCNSDGLMTNDEFIELISIWNLSPFTIHDVVTVTS